MPRKKRKKTSDLGQQGLPYAISAVVVEVLPLPSMHVLSIWNLSTSHSDGCRLLIKQAGGCL